jgi:GTPase
VSLVTVPIVGRPNVGKSTLFNRILGRHAAIVDETAGVTRDRHYGTAEWRGQVFRIVDTGGIGLEDSPGFMTAIRAQTECAVKEADLVLFVIDVREGITAADQEIALHLHKAGKTVLLVANKAETAETRLPEVALYQLGFGDPFYISAEHGQGAGDLLDAVVSALPSTLVGAREAPSVQVAIVGRPNVGKSSLINRILGEHRLLVDSMPGTTRDAIDIQVKVHKRLYTLVDTAGMRKPRRIYAALEKTTVAVSLKRVQQCDVAVLMLDALAGIGEQDVRLGVYIEQQGKACIVAINKWDALAKDTQTYGSYVRQIHDAMPFLAHAPILSISALTGQRTARLFPLIDVVLKEAKRRVPVAQLQTFLKVVTQQYPAPLHRGNTVKFSFLTQIGVQPPTFLFFVNRPEGVTPAYQRYLENQLRHAFGFAGTPLRLLWRKKRGE